VYAKSRRRPCAVSGSRPECARVSVSSSRAPYRPCSKVNLHKRVFDIYATLYRGGAGSQPALRLACSVLFGILKHKKALHPQAKVSHPQPTRASASHGVSRLTSLRVDITLLRQVTQRGPNQQAQQLTIPTLQPPRLAATTNPGPTSQKASTWTVAPTLGVQGAQ